jgi:predicted CoA-binding protein
MSRNSLETIQEFLRCRRIAVVGVSREKWDFSRSLFREMASRGYDVVPVNPQVQEIEGRKCFASAAQIEPKVEAALLMTSPGRTPEAARECVEAGVHLLWLYRGVTQGSVPEVPLELPDDVKVVNGECPFMFLPDSGMVHGLHALVRKVTGRYPA